MIRDLLMLNKQNEPWDISGAVQEYTKDVSANCSRIDGVFISTDGTKMYISNNIAQSVVQYTLSTAWNVSTASYLRTLSVSATTPHTSGIYFNSTGTRMFLSRPSPSRIDSYSLSTAWDISTAAYLASKDVTTQGDNAYGFCFSTDGTKMYVVNSVDICAYYTLSTAWDLTTCAYANKYLTVSGAEDFPVSVGISADGKNLYVGFNMLVNLKQYKLATAYDLQTATFTADIKPSQYYSVRALYFKQDGTKMYVSANTEIMQLKLT